jgi:2-dehydro-3-deoxy-D-arabinonate dehydratase
MPMKLCRFQTAAAARPRVGLLLDEHTILDLSAEGIDRISSLLEFDGLLSQLTNLAGQNLPRHALSDVRLLAPVEQQEVWAVGVTYLRSKKARMEESDFSATAYDKVYDAPRPELFFKALPEKVVAPGEAVGIRQDAKWNVPEPELTFVLNSRGRIAGYTIGNDMSSRDIEGENLLYLPQAKIYDRSCAVGPFIAVGVTEAQARTWLIRLTLQRGSQTIFEGETSVGQIKRSFEELVGYLFRSQTFPHGAMLLTGTGIVPPDGFTLLAGDRIQIRISGIGMLENVVAEV